MKIELALAKIKAGKSGVFRPVKPGEEICDGDIEVGLGYVTEVLDKCVGQKVEAGEAIIRLEFTK